jgi:NTE family protein
VRAAPYGHSDSGNQTCVRARDAMPPNYPLQAKSRQWQSFLAESSTSTRAGRAVLGVGDSREETMPKSPVQLIPGDEEDRTPEQGIGLCLSGGGYRAMVFHLGVLWRLYEGGLLGRVKRISSVSGGSITAGVLALKWGRLSFDSERLRTEFVPEVVAPVRALADETIDAEAIILGAILPGRVSDRVAAAYDKYLFGGATLQDLPDEPRFVINATNVQSGAIWRFMKPYMRDYRVGEVKRPTILLSQAVAASSAFPPVLSPTRNAARPGGLYPEFRHRPPAPALHQPGDSE